MSPSPTPSLPAAIREALSTIYQALGFFASAIKSGEDWTPTCADEQSAAWASSAALEAHLLALTNDAAIGEALRSTLATANGARLCIHDFVSGSDVSFDDTFGPPTTDATRALETALRLTPPEDTTRDE